jgi:two-component system response regulator
VSSAAVWGDGREALDYLFGLASYSGRDCADVPVLVLIAVDSVQRDGLEALRWLREDSVTRQIPVMVLIPAGVDPGISTDYELGLIGITQRPLDFHRFVSAIMPLGLCCIDVSAILPQRT